MKRRQFLTTTVTGIAGGIVFRHLPVHAFNSTIPASERINVGLIGVRNMGWANLRDFLSQPGIICKALVDVDQRELERRASDVLDTGQKKPDLYGDYRKMLEDKEIDVVIVGTPDHWHCLHTVDSLEAGKHVYVEKPLANSIAEINVMLDTARKTGKKVQVGQQQRSGAHWKSAIELVKTGKLGKIRQVKYWGNFAYGAGRNPVPDSDPPPEVDYNTWLGPAPLKPFNQNRFHGSWRMFRNYGGGLMTDWGVHLIDMGLWGMDVKQAPNSVTAMGGTFAHMDNALEWPDTLHVHYDMGDYMMTWEHNGGLQTGPWGRNYGVAFLGSNGTLVADRDNWEVIAEWDQDQDKFRIDKGKQVKTDNMSHVNHVANFVKAIREDEELNCDIEKGHRAALFAHLGNLAFLTGDKLKYNENSRNFGEGNRANSLLKPEYRKPWQFPVA